MIPTPILIAGVVIAAPAISKLIRMFYRDLSLSDLRSQERILDQGNSLMTRVNQKVQNGEYIFTIDELSNLSNCGIFQKKNTTKP